MTVEKTGFHAETEKNHKRKFIHVIFFFFGVKSDFSSFHITRITLLRCENEDNAFFLLVGEVREEKFLSI